MISVLLVDDEPVILDIARAFLERHGEFTVTTVLSAEEGLTLLDEQNFDAVVSDYEMPVMNGLGFLRAIREKENHIPFIIFTGRGREDVVIEALNAGADYYIQKGGDPRAQFTELAYKIRESVRKKKEIAAPAEHEHVRTRVINHIRALEKLVSQLQTNGVNASQEPLIHECNSHIHDLLTLFGEHK
ncbi:response regulator [Methanospirillum stamsii]|uniref:Response regulator n=1 Tax=Methanospirillum stamsii TaxID=1277351 RepID=A0A2V2MWV5_9EURY|nr:response regulator [Methanospirillum stamsii]PWR70745.1 response regulator [Methanospirillum stamsii]